MKKQCSQCRLVKDTQEFFIRKGNPQAYCKVCQRKYCHTYYTKNKSRGSYAPEYRKEIRRKSIERARQLIFTYLLEHPCIDCGELDPIVLEFDHIKGTKTNNISRLIGGGTASLKTIQSEIDKCEVVCRNCHIRRETKRGNWWKLNYAPC